MSGYLNRLKGNNDQQRLADLNRRVMAERRRQERVADANRKQRRLLRRNGWK